MTTPAVDQPVKIPTENDLLSQGSNFRPRWWTQRIHDPAWSAFLNDLPDEGREYRHITRRNLLTAGSSQRPETLPRLLVAAYVWGTGPSAFLVGRRARAFRDNTKEIITNALTNATRTLIADGPVAAYASMTGSGPNRLKYLGPSFLTKVLYAADCDDCQPGRALILDQFVVIGLNDLQGWGWAERGPWTPSQYGRWLDYAHDFAARHPAQDGKTVRADAIELAVFKHGWTVYQARRAARTRA